MRQWLSLWVLVVLVTASGTALVGTATAASTPVRSISVSGTGVALNPGFRADVERYSLETTAGTAGTVTVDASTSDPAGVVRVNGTAVRGRTTVTGLDTGDEISVIITDASGTTAYALIYLPPGFPHVDKVVDEQDVEDGQVLVTLGKFAAALDRNGVPSWVGAYPSTVVDFKPVPGGYSVTRLLAGAGAGDGDWEVIQLDKQFRPLRRLRNIDLVNTDSHDSILRADGSRILIGYEPNPDTGLTDATIQEVDGAGNVVYTWNTKDHLVPADETTNATPAPSTPNGTNGNSADYAHLNSIQQLPDGDILASFRHFSSVMKIAWSDHDGFQRGDIVWRLGGRHSDFTFVDDPEGGPCAQHTAHMLPNGHIMFFDNGSDDMGGYPSFCVDPADRDANDHKRFRTRVTEYELDETDHTATLVWEYDPDPDRFAYFAGSAQRLPGGNTLVGWASYYNALVTEVDEDAHPVWELTTKNDPNPDPSGRWAYRAVKADVPDAFAPEVSVSLPDGTSYDAGARVDTPTVRCTDRGGSTLRTCAVSPLDTSTPGDHTFQVTATDGAGNRTVVARSYHVRSGRPDVSVLRGGAWASATTADLPRKGAKRRVALRLVNDSVQARSMTLQGPRSRASYRYRYRYQGHDVTNRVVRGTWQTPRLAPGASVRLTMVLTRLVRHAPRRHTARLVSRVAGNGALLDSASVVIRARRY